MFSNCVRILLKPHSTIKKFNLYTYLPTGILVTTAKGLLLFAIMNYMKI